MKVDGRSEERDRVYVQEVVVHTLSRISCEGRNDRERERQRDRVKMRERDRGDGRGERRRRPPPSFPCEKERRCAPRASERDTPRFPQFAHVADAKLLRVAISSFK